MATYYVELDGGRLQADAALKGGTMSAAVSFSGAVIYPAGGGGGGGATLQTKSVSYTPAELNISATVTPDPGYDGLDRVNVSVDAIPSTYVGSGITRRTSSDLTSSGATVTAPSGYYENSASKTIANASAPYIDGYDIESDGTLSVDMEIDTGGYLPANAYQLSLQGVPVIPAQTFYPSTSDQTIPAYKWTTGAQTIKGVTTTNLTAANIKKDVVVEIGDSADSDRILRLVGTYEGGGGGTIVAKTITANGTYNAEDDNADGYSPVTVDINWTDLYLRRVQVPYSTTGTALWDNCLYQCTGVLSLDAPNVTTTGTSACRGCTRLASARLDSLQIIGGSTGSTSKTGLFYGCTALTDVWMPKVYYFQGQEFYGCTALTGLDFPLLKTIKASTFNGCTKLKTLILRRSEVATVSNINSFNNTPFASSGSGGTLYVPQSLISSYQSASVWSTLLGYANNQIKAIEGSEYEDYYYNGDPIS